MSGIDLAALVASDLGRVELLQLSDGGFAGWPGGQRSQPFESAYLAECFGRVGRARFKVDLTMKSLLRDYLGNMLEHPNWFDAYSISLEFVAYFRFAILRGLDGLGDKRDSYLESIYGYRGRFSYATRRAKRDIYKGKRHGGRKA